MILANRHNKHGPSLNAQIEDAEQQLIQRRQSISVDSNQLINDIRQQMTAPGSLLLACSVGFVSGELSRCPTTISETASRTLLLQAQDIKTALSLIISSYTLYKALAPKN